MLTNVVDVEKKYNLNSPQSKLFFGFLDMSSVGYCLIIYSKILYHNGAQEDR